MHQLLHRPSLVAVLVLLVTLAAVGPFAPPSVVLVGLPLAAAAYVALRELPTFHTGGTVPRAMPRLVPGDIVAAPKDTVSLDVQVDTSDALAALTKVRDLSDEVARHMRAMDATVQHVVIRSQAALAGIQAPTLTESPDEPEDVPGARWRALARDLREMQEEVTSDRTLQLLARLHDIAKYATDPVARAFLADTEDEYSDLFAEVAVFEAAHDGASEIDEQPTVKDLLDAEPGAVLVGARPQPRSGVAEQLRLEGELAAVKAELAADRAAAQDAILNWKEELAMANAYIKELEGEVKALRTTCPGPDVTADSSDAKAA